VEALLTPMFNIIRDKRNKRNEFLTNLVKACDQREKTVNNHLIYLYIYIYYLSIY